jgi:hypothetical protein
MYSFIQVDHYLCIHSYRLIIIYVSIHTSWLSFMYSFIQVDHYLYIHSYRLIIIYISIHTGWLSFMYPFIQLIIIYVSIHTGYILFMYSFIQDNIHMPFIPVSLSILNFVHVRRGARFWFQNTTTLRSEGTSSRSNPSLRWYRKTWRKKFEEKPTWNRP